MPLPWFVRERIRLHCFRNLEDYPASFLEMLNRPAAGQQGAVEPVMIP